MAITLTTLDWGRRVALGLHARPTGRRLGRNGILAMPYVQLVIGQVRVEEDVPWRASVPQ